VQRDDVELLLRVERVVGGKARSNRHRLGRRNRGAGSDGGPDACYNNRVPYIGKCHGASHIGQGDRIF